MKRLVCILLCLVFAFSFTACGNDEKKEKKDGIDIEYYAKLGQMPELNYPLGTDVEKVKNELSATAESEEGEHSVYSVTEGENNVLIDNGEVCYYYKKAAPEKGIGYIVNYDKAYGFEIGTISLEVKEALKDYNPIEEQLTEENAFFMFGVEDGTIIKCEIENNTVLFVFDENALCATALYVTKEW